MINKESVLFKDLSIGAYFGMFKDILNPLWQKTTEFHALRYIANSKALSGLGYETEEWDILPDEQILDTSDPLDRRRAMLAVGDSVVVPVWEGIATGIVDKILPQTKAALKQGINNWLRVMTTNYSKDKTAYLWSYSWVAKPFRSRVKVLLDGSTKARQFKAHTMYRGKLELC